MTRWLNRFGFFDLSYKNKPTNKRLGHLILRDDGSPKETLRKNCFFFIEGLAHRFVKGESRGKVP
jgi:hypothetical protein